MIVPHRQAGQDGTEWGETTLEDVVFSPVSSHLVPSRVPGWKFGMGFRRPKILNTHLIS